MASVHDFEVEAGVPIPEKGGPKDFDLDGRVKYPFGDMSIGESFFSACAGHKEIHKIRAAASGYGSYNGKKFMIKREPGGCRCWRVA